MAKPSSARWARHADLLGFNYRLGELEAAIATVQLGRLEELTEPRVSRPTGSALR